MPLPGSRLCLICGQVLGSNAERLAHIEAEHPGESIRWTGPGGRHPYHVAADGTETRIGASALKRMRTNARRVQGLTPTPRGTSRSRQRGRRPVSLRKDTPEPAMVEVPTDDPEAPPYFRQVQPPRFALGGEAIGPSPTDGEGQPIPTAPDGASRETIRVALDRPMLAEIIRNLSITLSEWDGAGERGYFSHIEAGQLAMLLHEPAIDMVERYFAGNVNRFRLALAAVVILLGKGRIHYAAIRSRQAEAADDVEAGEYVDALAAQSAAGVVIEVPTNGHDADEPDDLAVLAERQRQWRATPQPNG